MSAEGTMGKGEMERIDRIERELGPLANDMTDDAAWLIAELRRALAANEAAITKQHELVGDVAVVMAQLTAARAALKKYGRHLMGCPIAMGDTRPAVKATLKCNCGFDKAIAGREG